ncbi:hypothetical protein [Gymnodinialimonas sp.]
MLEVFPKQIVFLAQSNAVLIALFVMAMVWVGVAHGQSNPDAISSVQFDAARNIQIDARSGCGVPDRSSAVRRQGVYTITLQHGDVGVCPGDDTARHNAPYWERALIYSRQLPKEGRSYRISGEFRFDPEAASAGRTTFFQVHQHQTPNCSCYPFIMINVDPDGAIAIESPSLRSRYIHYLVPGWTRDRFAQGWTEIAVDVTTVSGQQTMTVYFGGE